MSNPNGRPIGYEPSMLPDLIASVEKAKGSMGQVADLNNISRSTFYDWLRWGDEDVKKGDKTSNLAQLSCKIRKKQADIVCGIAERAFGDDKAARFITWWLGKICREDFGVEGMEIKELRDIFKVLLPLMNQGIDHGQAKEVDSKGD